MWPSEVSVAGGEPVSTGCMVIRSVGGVTFRGEYREASGRFHRDRSEGTPGLATKRAADAERHRGRSLQEMAG